MRTHKAYEEKLTSEIKVFKIHGEGTKYFFFIFL
jgi:hypothetical protein